YAIYPAFRNKRVGPIENFRSNYEPEYDAVVRDAMGQDEEGINFGERMLQKSALFRFRDTAQEHVRGTARSLAEAGIARIADPAVTAQLQTALAGQQLNDALVKVMTRGAAAMAEERVADRGRQFRRGKKQRFDDGFIPRTAELIAAQDIPQIVVIFATVRRTKGIKDPDQEQFLSDALAFFGNKGIPVVNVMDDGTITVEDYGSGDHYNKQGRRKVTEQVAQGIREVLKPSSN
ncbi:MAG: hypothetical protein AAFO79_10175, partial [Pseudomonadota bacterium]